MNGTSASSLSHRLAQVFLIVSSTCRSGSYCHSLDRRGHATRARIATSMANITARSSLITDLQIHGSGLLPRMIVIGSNQAAALALTSKIRYRQSTLPYSFSEFWVVLLLLAFLVAAIAFCYYVLYRIGRKLGGAS